MKRLVAIILIVTMCIGLLPTSAFAVVISNESDKGIGSVTYPAPTLVETVFKKISETILNIYAYFVPNIKQVPEKGYVDYDLAVIPEGTAQNGTLTKAYIYDTFSDNPNYPESQRLIKSGDGYVIDKNYTATYYGMNLTTDKKYDIAIEQRVVDKSSEEIVEETSLSNVLTNSIPAINHTSVVKYDPPKKPDSGNSDSGSGDHYEKEDTSKTKTTDETTNTGKTTKTVTTTTGGTNVVNVTKATAIADEQTIVGIEVLDAIPANFTGSFGSGKVEILVNPDPASDKGRLLSVKVNNDPNGGTSFQPYTMDTSAKQNGSGIGTTQGDLNATAVLVQTVSTMLNSGKGINVTDDNGIQYMLIKNQDGTVQRVSGGETDTKDKADLLKDLEAVLSAISSTGKRVRLTNGEQVVILIQDVEGELNDITAGADETVFLMRCRNARMNGHVSEAGGQIIYDLLKNCTLTGATVNGGKVYVKGGENSTVTGNVIENNGLFELVNLVESIIKGNQASRGSTILSLNSNNCNVTENTVSDESSFIIIDDNKSGIISNTATGIGSVQVFNNCRTSTIRDNNVLDGARSVEDMPVQLVYRDGKLIYVDTEVQNGNVNHTGEGVDVVRALINSLTTVLRSGKDVQVTDENGTVYTLIMNQDGTYRRTSSSEADEGIVTGGINETITALMESGKRIRVSNGEQTVMLVQDVEGALENITVSRGEAVYLVGCRNASLRGHTVETGGQIFYDLGDNCNITDSNVKGGGIYISGGRNVRFTNNTVDNGGVIQLVNLIYSIVAGNRARGGSALLSLNSTNCTVEQNEASGESCFIVKDDNGSGIINNTAIGAGSIQLFSYCRNGKVEHNVAQNGALSFVDPPSELIFVDGKLVYADGSTPLPGKYRIRYKGQNGQFIEETFEIE